MYQKDNVSEEVIITGANGLVGSYVADQLKSSYDLISFDISDSVNPVDITDKEKVLQAVGASTAKYLVHFAAFTDVTASWQQSNNKDGLAYKVNVLGTQNLVDACNEHGKHLIHTSTSYVFDGEKTTPYNESDAINPIEWYGETKALAENYITQTAKDWTIFRIDQPFRPDRCARPDLAHKIIAELQTGTLLPQFDDHFFGPTWIPDYAKTIAWAMQKNVSGLYHASNGESWTNYDFAKLIAESFDIDINITPSKLAEYLKTQQRPYQKNTALDCTKLQEALDFKPLSIREAVSQIETNL